MAFCVISGDGLLACEIRIRGTRLRTAGTRTGALCILCRVRVRVGVRVRVRVRVRARVRARVRVRIKVRIKS